MLPEQGGFAQRAAISVMPLHGMSGKTLHRTVACSWACRGLSCGAKHVEDRCQPIAYDALLFAAAGLLPCLAAWMSP